MANCGCAWAFPKSRLFGASSQPQSVHTACFLWHCASAVAKNLVNYFFAPHNSLWVGIGHTANMTRTFSSSALPRQCRVYILQVCCWLYCQPLRYIEHCAICLSVFLLFRIACDNNSVRCLAWAFWLSSVMLVPLMLRILCLWVLALLAHAVRCRSLVACNKYLRIPFLCVSILHTLLSVSWLTVLLSCVAAILQGS